MQDGAVLGATNPVLYRLADHRTYAIMPSSHNRLSSRAPRIPSLRRHRPSGRAVVTLSGRDHYLGAWPEDQPAPPPDVRAAYDRLIQEWLANHRRPVPTVEQRRTAILAGEDTDAAVVGLTVCELAVRFLAHADGYYRRPDGTPTDEVGNFKYALRPLVHLYGRRSARKLRPRHLKAVRRLMVFGYDHPEYGGQKPLARKVVNARVARLVRVFKWAAAEELAPAGVYRRLATLPPLRKGRTAARETGRVLPVAAEHVDAVQPHVRPPVAAMVRLQWLSGMRPGEVTALRLAEIDRSGAVWFYRPGMHKTSHLEGERVVALGPTAQRMILDFVPIRCPRCEVVGRPPRIGSRDDALCGPCSDACDEADVHGPWSREEALPPEAAVFSPARDREERFADLRSRRKSKVQPSQADRRKAAPQRAPGDRYSVVNYNNAVRRGCERAGVSRWHVNRLRHSHATEVQRRFGTLGVQAVLGHSKADTSLIYAERNLGLAATIAAQIG